MLQLTVSASAYRRDDASSEPAAARTLAMLPAVQTVGAPTTEPQDWQAEFCTQHPRMPRARARSLKPSLKLQLLHFQSFSKEPVVSSA
eukprot:360838-Chlamydomonas_euryale.AAC.5